MDWSTKRDFHCCLYQKEDLYEQRTNSEWDKTNSQFRLITKVSLQLKHCPTKETFGSQRVWMSQNTTWSCMVTAQYSRVHMY
jgi:hypothetical protein